jgi:LacI family transcriptional regulator
MVTQEQIARKLGNSRQLVTFALAGYPQVAAESRKKILAAARKMGYRPNPHARALKGARTGIIGLWIPDQISTHYTHVARELNRLMKQARHELIVSEVGNAAAEQAVLKPKLAVRESTRRATLSMLPAPNGGAQDSRSTAT